VHQSSAVALYTAEPTAAVLREPDPGALPADAASTMHSAAESISTALPAEPAAITVREPDPALPAESASDVLSAQSASDVLSAESVSNALPTEPTADILREPDSALPTESASTALSAEPAATAVREPTPGAMSAHAASTVYAAQSAAAALSLKPAAARLHGVQSATTRLHCGKSSSTVLAELAELSGESELYSTTNHGYPDIHAGSGKHSGRRGWAGSSGSRRCRTGVHAHAVHVSHQYAVYVHATDQYLDHHSNANALYTIHAGNTHDPYSVYSDHHIDPNDDIRWRGRIWRLLA
jgi:hypothetical protein